MAAVAVVVLRIIGIPLDVIDRVVGTKYALGAVVVLTQPVLAATRTPDTGVQHGHGYASTRYTACV